MDMIKKQNHTISELKKESQPKNNLSRRITGLPPL